MRTIEQEGNMKSGNVMDRGDYRLLPKGLRRMLVFSETFFFREYGKPKAPRKNQRAGLRC
jgi:hypothetical protein